MYYRIIMRMRRPGSRLTMLRKMGLCGRPVLQIGREPICQQRTRVAVDCSLDHHMTHKRVSQNLKNHKMKMKLVLSLLGAGVTCETD